MSNGHRGFQRSTRMARHWHSIPSSGMAHTASGTLIGGSLALDGPFTVVRMLGHFIVVPLPGGTFVALDSALISLAIGVVSSDAVAAGAGSVPDPTGEPDYPWLYWAEKFFLLPSSSDDANSGEGSRWEVAFDIRSQRKMKPRESLVVVSEYTDSTGAPPMNIKMAQTRVLVLT